MVVESRMPGHTVKVRQVTEYSLIAPDGAQVGCAEIEKDPDPDPNGKVDIYRVRSGTIPRMMVTNDPEHAEQMAVDCMDANLSRSTPEFCVGNLSESELQAWRTNINVSLYTIQAVSGGVMPVSDPAVVMLNVRLGLVKAKLAKLEEGVT